MTKLEIVVADFNPLIWLLERLNFIEITRKEHLEFYD